MGQIRPETARELMAACERGAKELDHSIPSGCWSTGPLTGDVIEDLVVCHGCRALAIMRGALSHARADLERAEPGANPVVEPPDPRWVEYP